MLNMERQSISNKKKNESNRFESGENWRKFSVDPCYQNPVAAILERRNFEIDTKAFRYPQMAKK